MTSFMFRRPAQLGQRSPFKFVLLSTCLCWGARGSLGQDAENDSVQCDSSACQESPQMPGTVLLQSSRQSHAKSQPSELSASRSVTAPPLSAKQSLAIVSPAAPPLVAATGGRFAGYERQITDVKKKGVAVIVPGLGSEERAQLVQQNVEFLKGQNVTFECWIYVYKTEVEFPLNVSRFEPCQVIRHPGQWLNHLLALPLNMTAMRWVLSMEDSTQPMPDVNLKRIFKIMKKNDLGHAAPTFDLVKNPDRALEYKNYQLLARQPDNKVGRFTDFIELHFSVFSRKYFACFQDYMDTSTNEIAIGWGHDRLLPSFCGGAIGGSERQLGKLGLLDQMTMVKKWGGSYDYGAASKGIQDFMAKHPHAAQPTYTSSGVLEEP